jgi:MoaA/NifB/PqqE/SkfB family radical SAM enzyme
MRAHRLLEHHLLRAVNVDRALPIQLDITNSCNLRCNHCYHSHHRNQGALSLSQWYVILAQYSQLIERFGYRPVIILCGGEPFTSPLLFPLISHIRKKFGPAPISILSNGTLISQSTAESLAATGGISVQISLDGATETTHDSVRGKNSFKRTREGVRALVSAGITVNILCVLSKRSVAEVPSFFELAKAWRVSQMNFTRLIAQGHAERRIASGVDGPLDGTELQDSYKSILKQSASTGVRTTTTHPLMHLLHPSLGSNGRFWEAIVIDYQGRMLASSRSRIVLGDAIQDGVESLFLNHPLFKNLRSGQIEGCKDCPHLRRCGGDRNAAYAASGNFLGRDPGCWILPAPLNPGVQATPTTSAVNMERI